MGAISSAQLQDFPQNGVQAQTLNELHGIVMQTAMLPDPEYRHDVRVVQPGCRLGLAPETLQVGGRKRGMEWQNLESHMPAERFLHSFKDDPHSTPGDLANDAIFPQLLGYLNLAGGSFRLGGALAAANRANFLDHDKRGEQFAN